MPSLVLPTDVGFGQDCNIFDVFEVDQIKFEVHFGQHRVIKADESEGFSSLLAQFVPSQVNHLQGLVALELRAELGASPVANLVF